jgi:hypothetical protein
MVTAIMSLEQKAHALFSTIRQAVGYGVVLGEDRLGVMAFLESRPDSNEKLVFYQEALRYKGNVQIGTKNRPIFDLKEYLEGRVPNNQL